MTFSVIFSKKGEAVYTVVNGFLTRQKAYDYICDMIEDIDYYKIDVE